VLPVTSGTFYSDRDVLASGMRGRLLGRAVSRGSITIPAVPAMLDDYVRLCLETFRALGVEFTEEQVTHLRSVLRGQLDAAFSSSPRSEIVITYDAPVGSAIDYRVEARWASIDAAYAAWLDSREPPLFGAAPDARVMAVARDLRDASAVPVLDLGAGTGRNALALARLGHPVDAVEMTTRFAEILEAQAREESLPVRVLRRDALDAPTDLGRRYHLLVASELVTDFRSDAQLRRLLHIAATCLAPGGHLVMNALIAREGYQPDSAALQFAQQVYSAILTRRQVSEAAAGLDLTLTADDDAVAYEREHLATGSWPPTGWFEQWAGGGDVFGVPADQSPIELRWLVFRKGAGSETGGAGRQHGP